MSRSQPHRQICSAPVPRDSPHRPRGGLRRPVAQVLRPRHHVRVVGEIKPVRATSRGQLAASVAGNLAGAALTLPGGSAATLTGALAVPLVTEIASGWMRAYSERQWRKASYVLSKAAELAGISAAELTSRLEAQPEREELLIRTLRAAHECSLGEKLIAFASALANGLVDERTGQVAWEEAFVRALDECDTAHLALLDKFTQTGNQLGLGQGTPEFDSVPDGLNSPQIRLVVPEYVDILDPLFAILERHALIRQGSTGLQFTRDDSNLHWRITAFGRQFLERLALVGASVAAQPDSTS